VQHHQIRTKTTDSRGVFIQKVGAAGFPRFCCHPSKFFVIQLQPLLHMFGDGYWLRIEMDVVEIN